MDVSFVPAAVVVMVGVPGSGKSTWCRARFLSTQIVSLDKLRGQVLDDETDQSANHLVVPLQKQILAARCQMGRTSVVDSTNVLGEYRDPLLRLAERNLLLPVAVVMDTPIEDCVTRNAAREHPVPEEFVRRAHRDLCRSVPAAGPLYGFAVTRRIGRVTDEIFGTAPAVFADAPWLR